MIHFEMLNPNYEIDALGFIPEFLDPADPDPATVQLNKNYLHGGGWRTQAGFKVNETTKAITYPEDPPMYPIALAILRDERIYVYESGYVMVLDEAGGYQIARMD